MAGGWLPTGTKWGFGKLGCSGWPALGRSPANLSTDPQFTVLKAPDGILAAHRSALMALRRALESVGIEFTNGIHKWQRTWRPA